MISYADDDDFDPILKDHINKTIAKTIFPRRVVNLRPAYFSFLLMLVFIFCSILAYYLVKFADNYIEDLFIKSYMIEISAGIVLYFINSLFMLMILKNKNIFILTVFLISVICAIVSYHSKGILQSYLSSLSIGVLLLLLIDIFIKDVQDKLIRLINESKKQTEDKYDEDGLQAYGTEGGNGFGDIADFEEN